MSLEIKGKIEKVLEVKKFPKKNGEGEWVTQDYLVKTDEEYNNLYCLNVFGEENVENFAKYNKVGDNVKVLFNVNTRENNGRYFTSLSSWRIEKLEQSDVVEGIPTVPQPKVEDDDSGLPF